MEILDVIKVLLPATLAFVVGIFITPLVAHYLYKYKAWKKRSVLVATDGSAATISQGLHNDEEKKTPRMGGIVVWLSVAIVTCFFWLYALIDGDVAEKLNFLSRGQTWLPLAALLLGACIGLVDDIYAVLDRLDQPGGGLSSNKRLLYVGVAGLVVGWWFYEKLGMYAIDIPFWGSLNIGIFIIPLVALVMIGIFAGGVIDGIDGLSGGIFATIFTAYTVIAFVGDQFDLAAFCATVVGGTLAFLWFNVPPARFYLSDTGTTALTMALTVVAFLSDAVVVLPIIAALLVAAAGSSALQLFSKKFFGRKIFIVAPLHHHFQAVGWPAYKVTMRFWILSVICATLGIIIALAG